MQHVTSMIISKAVAFRKNVLNQNINGKSYGRCGYHDGLTPILRKIEEEADAIILGAPIYLASLNGMTQALIERLIYPYLMYDGKYSSLIKKELPSGFIYTFGAGEKRVKQMGYDRPAQINQKMFEKYLKAPSESLLVTNTYQFDDYSKYETSGINVAEKTRVRQEVFPEDCRKAYEMGVRITRQIVSVGKIS